MQLTGLLPQHRERGVGTEPAPPPSVSENRLNRAAHDFEGQLLQELLKPMASAGLDEDGEDVRSGGVLGEFAAEALGRGLSDRGGLGIAEQILQRLSGESNVATRPR